MVPVLDCYTKRYNIQPLDICGATLTAFMQHELGKKNVRGGINDIQARLIKQALCLGTRVPTYTVTPPKRVPARVCL